ncbi:MAG: hypothetical protein L0323_18325 [Planctomycetes bacterium]|nr:hypothetical protein [Planctomycetota bacterium]
MRPKILLTLLLGGCAGLTVVVLSLRASRLDTTIRGAVSPELGEPNPDLTGRAVPAPAVPPLPPSAQVRKPATSLTARVALGGFLRKVVWEPDRDEPIREATVRVVLSTSNGTEEELGRCVTDERGAFALEADLPYGRLPAAVRLKPEKEGWAEAWPVSGLPLAIDALPHARTDLVWHMTRAENVGPREGASPVEVRTGDGNRARPRHSCSTDEGCFFGPPKPR